MSGNTEELKQKLEEMLASSDREWVHSVTVTLNAMHRQFELEQRAEKTIIPFNLHKSPRKRSEDCSTAIWRKREFVLLIF